MMTTSIAQWVGVVVLRATDSGFEPRSGQTKDYTIDICCFSTKHAAFTQEEKEKTD